MATFVAPSGVDCSLLPSCMFTEAGNPLCTNIKQFYKEGRFTDITVVAEDKRRFKCHRVVLAAHSSKLSDALDEEDFPPGSELVLHGIQPAALEAIITFFYASSIHITVPFALPILAGAIKLDIAGLQPAVHSFVAQILGREPGLMVSFLEQSIGMKMDSMTESLLAYSVTRWDQCMSWPCTQVDTKEAHRSSDPLTLHHWGTAVQVRGRQSIRGLPLMQPCDYAQGAGAQPQPPERGGPRKGSSWLAEVD